jgi:hypothetical protein
VRRASRRCAGTKYRYRLAHDLRLEGQDWLRRITRLVDERLAYRQHGAVLAIAGMLALLVGCVEYDTGDGVAAVVTPQFAKDPGAEIDNRDVMGWAHEMTAWFALTSGDYHRVVAAREHSTETSRGHGASVELARTSARLVDDQRRRRPPPRGHVNDSGPTLRAPDACARPTHRHRCSLWRPRTIQQWHGHRPRKGYTAESASN